LTDVWGRAAPFQGFQRQLQTSLRAFPDRLRICIRFFSSQVLYFRNTQIYLCHTKSTPNASVPIHRQIVDQVARLIAGGNMAEEATRYRVFAGIETFLKKYSPAR